MSDINVTPFVDVLLILLVAFFISAPLLTHSLPIRSHMVGRGPHTIGFHESMGLVSRLDIKEMVL